MNVLWEDLVDEVVHRFQNDVVPTVQKVHEKAAHHHFRDFQQQPPSSTDLVYVIDDRLLISSQPAVARWNPSYDDVGRDDSRPWYTGDEGNDDKEEDGVEHDGTYSGGPMEEPVRTDNVGGSSSSPTALGTTEAAKTTTVVASPTENPQDGGMIGSSSDGLDPSPDFILQTNREARTAFHDDGSTAVEAIDPFDEHQRGLTELLSTARTETSVTNHNDAGTNPLVQQPLPKGSETERGADDTMNQSNNLHGDVGVIMSVDSSTTAAEVLHPPPPENTIGTTAMGEPMVHEARGNMAGATVDYLSPKDSPTVATSDERSNTNGVRKSPTDDATVEILFVDQDENDVGSAPPVTKDEGPLTPPPQQEHPTTTNTLFNSPAKMVEFLEKRHGTNSFLAFSLTSDRPDDRTLLLFRRQIVQMGWWSPCPERSETPSISQILKVCYAIHAYLKLDPTNVALVYCTNGKTRTAIAVACYLKFAGFVTRAKQGFLQVLTKLGMKNTAQIWEQLPPSLKLFFQQFDTAVELGGFLNHTPLLLRAITLQGIPVDDKPCLDIWDSSQRHVYTSHPELMWQQEQDMDHPNNNAISQWADEEGFYRVNVVLEGDFLVLCRFGGDFAEDPNIHDPSKILFRYSNTTGFLSGGYPYELTPNRVDLSRRYAAHLDDEDFLVTLLFEAHWERFDQRDEGEYSVRRTVSERLGTRSSICSEIIHRSYDNDACEEGLRLIVQHHSARPDQEDIEAFQKFDGREPVDGREDHLICLALQLTNFDWNRSKKLLFPRTGILGRSMRIAVVEQKPVQDKYSSERSKQLAAEVLGLLDEVHVDSIFDEPDREQLNASLQSNAIPFEDSGYSTAIPVVQSTGWMVPSLSIARRGDICGAFSDHYRQFYKIDYDVSCPSKSPIVKPRIPYFPRNKPALIPAPFAKRQRRGEISRQFIRHNRYRDFAWQVHDAVDHPDITLANLATLVQVSQTFTLNTVVSDEEEEADNEKRSVRNPPMPTPRGMSMNREAKEQQQKKWEDAKNAEAEKRKAEAAKKKQAQDEAKKKEISSNAKDDNVPLKDNPEYSKYFRMLRMSMSREQVLHAMTRDGKDHSILDLDPEKSLKSQRSESKGNNNGPPLNEDPEYSKFFKMLRMMPKEQVVHAMTREGKDPRVLDLDPSKSLKSQTAVASGDGDDGPALKDDPEYAKYFKMLKCGLPVDVVKNALTRDGKDPTLMDLDPNKSLKSQRQKTQDVEVEPALKDDPEYAKYFKMIKCGLPLDAVKNALTRDGKDPAIVDLDPEKSLKAQCNGLTGDTGVPLQDDPEYQKYFRMLRMGLPVDAVKNALSRDGKNPAVLEMDPTKSLVVQENGGLRNPSPIRKKKRVRRKKIYWNPIDPTKLKEDSMWNIVRGSFSMGKLNYDQKEFEDLFTESADTKRPPKQEATKEQKKLVQVIDPKRSMNGGIVLSRLKIDYVKLAEFVNVMDHQKFDSTQLKALKEYLPDADERQGLISYMKNGEDSSQVKEKLFADCSETEKYMVTMIDVKDAGAKLDAMLFRSIFKSRFEDATEGIRILNSACEQLRSSEKLRKLMAMILTVVNQINTGGEGNMAMGFTLDALLKLNEAKAFDKKTSVLHYVVKLVKKNDETLLSFASDVSSVTPAESVLLDGLSGDVKSISEELDGISDIVQQQAEQPAGDLNLISTALAERRMPTPVDGGVTQSNKPDLLTGRTSMERFFLSARKACMQASESIDNIKKKYRAVLQYFGEDENMATADFFGTIRRFMVEWNKAVAQVEAIERKEVKERRRAEARAARAQSSGKPTSRKNSKAQGNTVKKPTDGFGREARVTDPSRKYTDNENAAVTPTASAEPSQAAKGPPLGGIATFAADAANRLKTKGTLSHPAMDVGSQSGAKAQSPALIPGLTAGVTSAWPVAEAVEKHDNSGAVGGTSSFQLKSEPADTSKSKFFSAATAYRDKKSQRGLASQVSQRRIDTEVSGKEDQSIEVFSRRTLSTFSHESQGDKLSSSEVAIANEPESAGTKRDIRLHAYSDMGSVVEKTSEKETMVSSKAGETVEDISPKALTSQPNTHSDATSRIAEATSDSSQWVSECMEVKPKLGTSLDARDQPNVHDRKELLGLPKTMEELRGPDSASDGVTWRHDQAVTKTSPRADSARPMGAQLETLPLLSMKTLMGSDQRTLVIGGVIGGISHGPGRSDDPRKGEGDKQQALAENIEPAPHDELEDIPAYESYSPQKTDYRLNSYSDGASAVLTLQPGNSIVSKEEEENPTLLGAEIHNVYTHDHIDDAHLDASTGPPSMGIQSAILPNMDFIPREAPARTHETISNEAWLGETNNEEIPGKETTSRDSKQEGGNPFSRRIENGVTGEKPPERLCTSENDYNTTGLYIDGFPDHKESGTAPKSPATIPFDEIFHDSLDKLYPDAPETEEKFCLPTFSMSKQTLSPMYLNSVTDTRSSENVLISEADFGQACVEVSFDESSVAIMAENMHRRNEASEFTDSWMNGDTIQNFLGWADQAIKASDTESVRNFEISVDLNGLTDFDDESTIATVQDDLSVMSGLSPTQSSHYRFEASGVFDINPPFDESENVNSVTVNPSQVAAAILFNDSPSNSVMQDGNDDLLNMGLSFPTDISGLDTGLSFGIDDAGFDDGLGFGGTGFGYGNEDDLNDVGGGSPSPIRDKKEDQKKRNERKSWFLGWIG